MTYEELIKVSNGRIEELDDMLQMLSPAEVGKRCYNRLFALYEKFSRTGDMGIFEKIVDGLYAVCGYRV